MIGPCTETRTIHGLVVPCTGAARSRHDTTHLCEFKEPTAPTAPGDPGPCDGCGSTTAEREHRTIDRVVVVACVNAVACNRRSETTK